MSNNNNNTLLIAGVAIAFLMFNKAKEEPSQIAGTENKRRLIKKYLEEIGLPEGHSGFEAMWNKMTENEIILDAFLSGILLVSENDYLRKIITRRYLKSLGLNSRDNAYDQLLKKWKKWTLKQIIDDGYNRGIILMETNFTRLDKKGKKIYDSEPKFF